MKRQLFKTLVKLAFSLLFGTLAVSAWQLGVRLVDVFEAIKIWHLLGFGVATFLAGLAAVLFLVDVIIDACHLIKAKKAQNARA